MPLSRPSSGQFGSSFTGLVASVGYQLVNADKTLNGSRVTGASITEYPTGSGAYIADIAYPDGIVTGGGWVAWDTSGACAPIVGAVGPGDFAAVDASGNTSNATVTTNLDATVSSRASQTSVNTVQTGVTAANVTLASNLSVATSALATTVALNTKIGTPLTYTGGLPNVNIQTGQLTAAQIATGVWQDTTAGDFTTANSIGKSLFTGVAPGNQFGGIVTNNSPFLPSAIVTSGSVNFSAGITANITGNLSGNIGGKVLGGGSSTIISAGVWSLDSMGEAIATQATLNAVGTNVATLLSRITDTLFSGMTSLSNWLRTLARSSTPDATALAEINSGGGTFVSADDSLQAIGSGQSSDLTAAQVWSYGNRTLTSGSTPTTVIPSSGASTTYTGSTVYAGLNYPLQVIRVYRGLDLTSFSQIVWTAKTSDAIADSAATLTVVLSNPPAGTDGLQLLNGAAPVSPTTAADGALTVNTQYAVSDQVQTTISLTLTARGMGLIASEDYAYELTNYSGGIKAPVLDGGTLSVSATVRQNPAQS